MEDLLENLYFLEVIVKTVDLQISNINSIKVGVDFCQILDFFIDQDESAVKEKSVYKFDQGRSLLFFETFKNFSWQIREEPLIFAIHHDDQIIGKTKIPLLSARQDSDFVGTRPITIKDTFVLRNLSSEIGTITVFVRCTTLGSKVVPEDVNESAIISKINVPLAMKRQTTKKSSKKTSRRNIIDYSSSDSQAKDVCRICVTCSRLHNLESKNGNVLSRKNQSSVCVHCKAFLKGIKGKSVPKIKGDRKCSICSISSELLLKKFKTLKKNSPSGSFKSRNCSSINKCGYK